MLFRFLSLISVLFTVPLIAQDGGCGLSLKGQVNDEDNQEHLSFAVVKLSPGNKVVQTDEHGNFVFAGLCNGDYSLTVSHVGCRDTVIRINLVSHQKIQLKLPHSLNALYDVEVVAAHNDQQPAQAAYVLDKGKLLQVRGEDLAHQLEVAPGVRMLQTGPTISKPMLNGMQGYRTLLLNNGVRQEGQQWGSEHAPEIDPNTAGKITVLRGAAAVRYGSDAMGGVVLLEPDVMPDTAAVTGEAGAGYESNGRIFTTSAMVQGYFDRLKYLSWRVQGSLKNGGSIKAPEYYISNTGVREGNFSYGLDYHRKKFGASVYYSQFNTRIGIFSGSHISNLTDLVTAFEREKPTDSLAPFSRNIEAPYQLVEHELVKVAGDVHTGPRSRINFLYALQYNKRREFDAHGEQAHGDDHEPEAASAYYLQTHGAELSWEHDYIRSWRGRFGLQGQAQENICKGSYFIPNYKAGTVGAFAIERFVRSHFEIEAGVRYDRKQMQSFFYEGNVLREPELFFDNLSYNVGGLYRNKHLHFTLHLASGWRAPSVNELYSDGLHHGAAAIEVGSTNLRKEQCTNIVSAVQTNWERFRATLTAYHYNFGNYIYYAPTGEPQLTLRGAFPVFSYTQTAANISGADIEAAFDLLPFLAIEGRAMWVRGTEARSNQPLIYMPADRYSFGFNLHSQSGRKVRGLYIKPSITFTEKQTRVPYQQDYVQAPGAYGIINVEGGIQFYIDRHAVDFSLGCKNLLNARYRDYLDRFRYYTDAPGRSVYLRLNVPFTIFDKK